MRQLELRVIGDLLGSLLIMALTLIASVERASSQTEPGTWKCYHSGYMNICGANGEGTAIEDYYAVKWPFCKLPNAPSCYNPSNSSEWCDGVCMWHAGVPPHDIPMPARGAANLYCPTGTVARQGVCVVVSKQGEKTCPIVSNLGIEVPSGTIHKEDSDWMSGDTLNVRSASTNGYVYRTGEDFSFELTRYYSSDFAYLNFPFSSRLGIGWRTAYDASARANTTSLAAATLLHFVLPNSLEYSFLKQSGIWKPVNPRLLSNGLIKWDVIRTDVNASVTVKENQVTFQNSDGISYVFDSAGKLIRRLRGASYVQTLEYSGGLNTRIVDNIGRWMKFIYAHPSKDVLLTDVEIFDGTRISYRYENRYLDRVGHVAEAEHSGYWVLHAVMYSSPSQVSQPETLGRSYEYLADRNMPFLLTGIQDGQGLQLASLAYDQRGRVISSEAVRGKSHWQFSYDDAKEQVHITDSMGQTFMYPDQTLSPERPRTSLKLSGLGQSCPGLEKDCHSYCTDKCIGKGLGSDAPFCYWKCMSECETW